MNNAQHRTLRKVVKVSLWTLMAVVLFVVGALICLVRVLTPETLTPMLEKYANKELDADVEIGSVDLTFRGSFPFVDIDIDTLVITSRQVKALPAHRREAIPAWADTLFSVERMHGAFNIPSLAVGRLDIDNVDIVRPQLNLFVGDSVSNYQVFRHSEESTSEAGDGVDFPNMRLRHFRFVEPKPVRYADVVNDVNIDANLAVFEINGTDLDENGTPKYNVKFESSVRYPLLQRLGMGCEIPVNVEGMLKWENERHSVLLVSDFNFRVGRLAGVIDSELDFSDRFTLNTLDFQLDPVSVSWALGLVPDSTAVHFSIPKDIDTDAALGLHLTIDRPLAVGYDLMPHATLCLDLPDCRVHWRDLDVNRLNLGAKLQVHGLNLNAATVDIDHLDIEGPAGDMHIDGHLSRPFSDPDFNGRINGVVYLGKLPKDCLRQLPASVSGTVKADASVKARASMFTPDNYLDIAADGIVSVRDFTWLDDDVKKMYHIGSMDVKLGSPTSAPSDSDKTLCADIKIDSAQMLAADFKFEFRDVDIAVNTSRPEEEEHGVPLHGTLHSGYFDMAALTSGSGLTINDLDGCIAMLSPTQQRSPRFNLDLAATRISAGSRDSRLVLGRCHLKAIASGRHPEPEVPERFQHTAHHRSPAFIAPGSPMIPIDSIYGLALRVHNMTHHPGHHRVHPATDSIGDEYIDWGTTRVAYTLLNDWDISGRLTAASGQMVSPAVHIPNMARNFNLSFSNDSARLTDIEYRAGHSDYLLSIAVSNMKRAFCAPDGLQALKISADIFSDTIDIDEVAAIFLGAPASDAPGNTDSVHTAHPLLIPNNIDAMLHLRADNVIYQGLGMKDFSGSVLMYDGALNLNDLRACSAVGSVNLSAQYSAPNPGSMNVGLGMKVVNFNVGDFLRLVPTVDSLAPFIRHLEGNINADLAATSYIGRDMKLLLPTTRGTLAIEGDSLKILDDDTYRSLKHWLLFRDKDGDIIPHAFAELTLKDKRLELLPFVFDFNRYRLGVQGVYNVDSTFNYHIAVLHSPIPFHFGIDLKGSPNHMSMHFGGAHLDKNRVGQFNYLAATRRIRIMQRLERLFRHGMSAAHFISLHHQ